MFKIKTALYILYILLIVCMGYATIIEKSHGTQYACENIYGAWWFSTLWAILTAAGTAYFQKRCIRNTCTVLLHLSFVIILLGALLTHLTSKQGMIHLRQGVPTDSYLAMEGDDIKEYPLPFTIRLDDFNILFHNGTADVSDYVTRLTIEDNGTRSSGTVSMNNIYSHNSYRLYQSSYDNDLRGSILALNYDPYGIPVTYLGYALLFFSLVFMLFYRKSSFRHILPKAIREQERAKADRIPKGRSVIITITATALCVMFLALTVYLAKRWYDSGNPPLANGYETMLLMAWIIMVLTLVVYRKLHIMLPFGFLLAAIILFVSHVSGMDKQSGPLPPVLKSPLLSVHVSIIMTAYAMLSVTFICGITAIIMKVASRKSQLESLSLLSRLFLYPALTCLGLGIFTGAIWANISWGRYWSWDPKETWALITFMVYAVAVHSSSLPLFRKPSAYHIYMVISFLTLLMTYFGVNYILGGMHSYA